MAELVSILAAGHSGSTLLDMVCGSIDGIFSLGEATYLPWQLYRTRDGSGSVENQDVCTCGARFQECPVWAEIVAALSARTGIDIQSSPFDFPVAILANQRYGAGRYGPKRFLRAAVPILLQRKCTRPLAQLTYPLNRRAVGNSWMMFDEISRSQKCEYVVDSTKQPERFWPLQEHRPKDVRVLVLVRDIRAVAYSDMRRYSRDGVKRAKGWVRTYNRILKTLHACPDTPVQMIRYEDLCADPEGTRTMIARFLGLSGHSLAFPLCTDDYHMVAGNPMRYAKSISVKYDDAWQTELGTEKEREILNVAQGLNPAWQEYGYAGPPFSACRL